MKSLLLLWNGVAVESATQCHTSATMDCKTVQGRVEHEGISFLTISLATFGKDFQKSLEQGYVDRRLFFGFRRKGELPRFLGGFLDRVFSRDDGRLVDQPCIDSIRAIRQLTLMFSKIALPCSDARYRAAMSDYVNCEQEVRVNDMSLSSADLADFRRIGSMLFASAFTEMDRKIYYGEFTPSHGPGNTAEKLTSNGRYNQRTWPRRLDSVFNSVENVLPNASFWEELDEVDFLEPGSEIPVRVISVPKTLKTPRIIGIEPSAMQYAQQAILPVILDSLSKDVGWEIRSPTGDKVPTGVLSGMLGFTDQEPNQHLAMIGSRDGSLATLDLSEASDRVSNQLVRALFGSHASLNSAVDACRSRKADVPGFGVLRLAKFASMGSALCFPVEAMVFLTIIFHGIEQSLNRPLTRKDIYSLVGRVRVYGDDIIVPVDYVTSVDRSLSLFGAKVNRSKSFWNGKFRESCGKEYYDGHDVSIVKVRHLPPARRQDVTGTISYVSLRNQLYWAGYWRTCQMVDSQLRRILRYFPVVESSSPVLGRESVLGYRTPVMCSRLHRPLVRGYVVSSTPPNDPLDGAGALLKFFLKKGASPSFDEKHLERSGRPHAVNIKLRWSPPF